MMRPVKGRFTIGLARRTVSQKRQTERGLIKEYIGFERRLNRLNERGFVNEAMHRKAVLVKLGYSNALVRPVVIGDLLKGFLVELNGTSNSKNQIQNAICRDVPPNRVYCNKCTTWDTPPHTCQKYGPSHIKKANKYRER
jgi:hypothetical protein